MPYADADRQRERNRTAARERMRRIRADAEGRERHNAAERERYWRRKNERTRAERDATADPVCIAIREGHTAARDHVINMTADREQYVRWAREKIAIQDGAPLILSSADVVRALQRAGLERLALSWRARIDCAAARWWSVPATGRMREVSANGRPLLRAAEACPSAGPARHPTAASALPA
ncbi:hypothetical protein [Microbacterium rhizosphaerae]|uniref:BZIP domain-containing protein n=2 Tax=Microbacterium rhizosphaerae TaxID=1678237 RepID=A0ABZ0SIV0_9MICO|nr:hypothetical protein [Microbacterium rhizosphaerae]WPR88395.1 hypothetical protein SM116_11460 [Microbacterium rhizosphaerae]